MTRYFGVAIAAFGMLLPVSSAHSEDRAPGSDAMAQLLKCREIKDDAARLTCLDARSKELSEAVSQHDLVVVDRADIRRTRRSLYGFTVPADTLFSERAGGTAQEREELSRLDTKVVSVAPTEYGLWIVKLAEGGTWMTVEADRAFEPSAGDTIVIKRAFLGNYTAKFDGGLARQIRRIR